MNGAVVWLTGLPQSGKSTLAERVKRALSSAGISAVLLDSDAIRAALVPTRGYSEPERDDFYASLANLAALWAKQGFVAVVPATAHRRRFRERARRLAPHFIEVYLSVPQETCAERDERGVYRLDPLTSGRDVPGLGVAYEAPEKPDVVAVGGRDDGAVDQIVALVKAACSPS